MSKHTPGPWVWDEDGAALRTIGEQSVCVLQDGEGLWNLWLNPCLKGGVGAANARLIAAAPLLYEALKDIAGTDPVDAALDPQRAVQQPRPASHGPKRLTRSSAAPALLVDNGRTPAGVRCNAGLAGSWKD